MCNCYRPSRRQELLDELSGLRIPDDYPTTDLFPRGAGAFVRDGRVGSPPDVVVGQWGLVPFFAKSKTLPYSTNNCRMEGVSTAASFKQPWAKGQRCLIPAEVFWEPCWESGKNEWWSFCRRDGRPLLLAGLWNTWLDKQTGELVESYTMLTQNADHHPLIRRMHKPDPKLPADQQDKRSVVVIERSDVDQWLTGTNEEASELVRLTPVEVFDARPSD